MGKTVPKFNIENSLEDYLKAPLLDIVLEEKFLTPNWMPGLNVKSLSDLANSLNEDPEVIHEKLENLILLSQGLYLDLKNLDPEKFKIVKLSNIDDEYLREFSGEIIDYDNFSMKNMLEGLYEPYKIVFISQPKRKAISATLFYRENNLEAYCFDDPR